jgi:ABC-type molybdenum transport system ATPase subunit/photorepair protein PhrA
MVSASVRQRIADEEIALETVVSGKYAMIDFWGRVTARDRREAMRILERNADISRSASGGCYRRGSGNGC